MQITLPIFSKKSFSDLLHEQDLHEIEIVPNSRLKKSWKIEKKRNHYVLFVPAKLADAPTDIREAMITWSKIIISNRFSKKRLSAEAKAELSLQENKIFGYLFPKNNRINHRHHYNPQKKFKDCSGVKFDLQNIFNKINREHFENRLISFLRWGQYGSKTSYHSIFIDEHDTKHHLITVAGLYNHPSTPDFALETLLYHEMLHIECPPIENSKRRTVHHSEFRRREKEFPDYLKWQKWLKTDAHKLVRKKSLWR